MPTNSNAGRVAPSDTAPSRRFRTFIYSIRRNAPLLHLPIALVIAFGMITLLLTHKGSLSVETDFLPHVQYLVFPEKPGVVLAYMTTCIVIALFTVAIYLFSRSRLFVRIALDLRPPRNPYYFVATLVAISFISILSLWFLVHAKAQPPSHRMSLLLFIGSISYGCWLLRSPLFATARLFSNALQRRCVASAVIFIAIISIVLIFCPLLFEAPRLLNEYLDIPSQIILKDGRTADVLTELTVRSIAGPHPFSNEADPGPHDTLPEQILIKASPTSALEDMVNRYRPGNIIVGAESAPDDSIAKSNRDELTIRALRLPPFKYDHERSAIVLCGTPTPADITLLIAACKADERDRITQEVIVLLSRLPLRSCGIADSKFVYAASDDLLWRIQSRFIIHHHNFMLGPMDQYLKGRPIDEINFQYGRTITMTFARILDWCGGLTMHGYHHALHLFHLIYLIALIICAAVALRCWRLTALFALGTATIIAAITHPYLILAPGLNPFRHACDAPVLLFAAMAFRCKGVGYFIWSLCACIFALLGVVGNATTGLPLLAGLLVAMGIRNVDVGMPLARALVLHLGILSIGIACAFITSGNDALAPYYLQGLVGLPESGAMVLVALCLIAFSNVFLIRRWKQLDRPDSLLFILCLLYSQGLFLYYVWGGSRFHFLNFAPLYLLTLLIGIKTFFSFPNEQLSALKGRNTSGGIAMLLTLAIAVAFVIALPRWVISWRGYESNFTTYVAHIWRNPRAKIVTTMPEEPFEEAIAIIRHHSDVRSGIAILSQYDNFIPFLADTYSNMPYPDSQWFINTEHEVNRIIEYIRTLKPDYIYLDSAILEDRSFEVFDGPLMGQWTAESLVRIRRLGQLTRIALAVIGDYEPVERGRIITAWKRRSVAP